MTERVTEMRGVYDLIIATCEHNPALKAWGASALRFLSQLDAPSPDRNPKGGDAKQGSVEDEGRFPAPNDSLQPPSSTLDMD